MELFFRGLLPNVIEDKRPRAQYQEKETKNTETADEFSTTETC